MRQEFEKGEKTGREIPIESKDLNGVEPQY
jgi:hypothetical protein